MNLNDRDPDQLRAWRERGARNWQANLRRNGGKGYTRLRNERAEQQFRVVIWERSGGLCEARTPACPTGNHRGVHAHHRSISEKRRGVHNPDHGLLTCAEGHRYIHDHPAESYAAGWLLRAAS